MKILITGGTPLRCSTAEQMIDFSSAPPPRHGPTPEPL